MDVDHFLLAANMRAHRLLPSRTYVLGREEGSDIRIDDALMSRRHLRLSWLEPEQAWLAEDLLSRNGTLLNGERLRDSRQLVDQDRIQLGGQVYQYYLLPPGADLGQLSSQAPRIMEDATLGPDFNPVDLASQGAAFSGAVGSGGVLELLQFLAMTRKTGRLDLLAGHSMLGWIAVDEGSIRAAEHAGERSFDAMIELLDRPITRFAFHAEAELSVNACIEGSTEAVLFEIARVLDERARG